MRQHHYRIVNPIRFFLFILVLVFTVTVAIYGLFGSGNAEAASLRTYAQVVVQPSDTLWSIASSYNSGYGDIREIVHDIYEINDLESGNIHPGDVVFVPVY